MLKNFNKKLFTDVFYDHSKNYRTRSTYYEIKNLPTHTKKRNPAKSFKSWHSTATTTLAKIWIRFTDRFSATVSISLQNSITLSQPTSCSPKSSSSSWLLSRSQRHSPLSLVSPPELLSLPPHATSTRETRREDAQVTLDMSASSRTTSPRTSP